MIRRLKRTLTVRPFVVAPYGLLFGAAAGLLLALAILFSRSVNVDMFFIFLPIAIVLALVVGGVMGLLSAGVGLAVRGVLSINGRLETVLVSVVSGLSALGVAVVAILVLGPIMEIQSLVWVPIATAFIGAVWFALWSNRQPAREKQTQGDLQDGD
ncbi:hypothetical protein [Salinibacterium sp. SWN248]|uniref:hypothetical protein n=1 Tax=Salinibacterium sp. SWN248 TaxID=2792056 RepID=UPI0018CEDB09|nr:hypothetical protein [Salinibacterium sp. SWN248]MBH0024747.1 hypothetical protein [Salinibacterium sp. SWN248]